jgi:hypothetical protein
MVMDVGYAIVYTKVGNSEINVERLLIHMQYYWPCINGERKPKIISLQMNCKSFV